MNGPDPCPRTTCTMNPPTSTTQSTLKLSAPALSWMRTRRSSALVRAVLADPRFSSRYELMHYPFAAIGELPPAAVGDLTGIDPPEHTRYRKLFTGKFTVRRMHQLTARIEQVTTEHLDAMERHGPRWTWCRPTHNPSPRR